jgi:hypothetical protein
MDPKDNICSIIRMEWGPVVIESNIDEVIIEKIGKWLMRKESKTDDDPCVDDLDAKEKS